MSLDPVVLRSSLNLVIERRPDLTHRFYEIFFSRYPQVVPMFGRNSQANQEQMLAQALIAVVDHLEDPAWLAETLRAMGERHKGYGVSAEMYPWVGECLLAAMAEAGADYWTPEVAEQWTQAYGAIVGMMHAE